MVVDRTRLAPACPRGVFAFPLAGKCKSMRVRLVLMAAARAAARFERELYGELLGRVVYNKRGWSISERAPVLAHLGSPSGGDRVIRPVRLGEILAK